MVDIHLCDCLESTIKTVEEHTNRSRNELVRAWFLEERDKIVNSNKGQESGPSGN
jgi:hypothetical protein